MKKKLLTLLALLVTAVGYVNAASVVWTFTAANLKDNAEFNASGDNIFVSTDASATELTFRASSGEGIVPSSNTIGGTSYTNYLKINGKGSTTTRNMTFAAPYAKFKITIVFASTVGGTYNIDDNDKASDKTLGTITPAANTAVTTTTLQTTVGHTINLYNSGNKCYIYSVICEEVTSDKTPSSFALTSDAEVEVAAGGTSTITSENAAGTVTYESANTAVATVSSTGVITAVAPGKTTITVSDPGSATVEEGSATVTVLVPYPNPSVADSYTLDNSVYGFSNTANTKYYFTNGFTITNTAGKTYGYASSAIKFSANTAYTINVPSNVDVYYAVINARSNYGSDKTAANWGTVFGTDYSSITLPYSDEDMDEKDFDLGGKQTGGTLVFTPGGNQVQMIIKLYGIEYKAKYAVTFDKGEGTGTMDGTEVRAGTTYILPGSTFTPPSDKGFSGWLCSIDGLTYEAGAEYTMTEAATTFTAQYAPFEGTAIIRVTLNGGTSATVTGSIGGTANVKVQSDKKFGSGHYAGFTLAGTNTFKTGDIINVRITTASENGTITIYDSDKSTVLYDTGERGVVGDNKFVLPAAIDGKSTLYICRTSSNAWNAFVDYIEVTRPVTISPAKEYTTLTSAFALDFTDVDGLKAYIVEDNDASDGVISMTQVNKVPAGTGLVIKKTGSAASYGVPVFDGTGADDVSGNKMEGSATATTPIAENGGYILSNGEFHPALAGDLPAGKAYLKITVTSNAPVMSFGDATAIDEVRSKMEDVRGDFYNLNGQRVAQPTKGLYIVNGKKVIMK